LDIRRAYPFGDDVLFRGSAVILEYLRVVLDPKLVAILKRHTVFTPTSHPKFRRVNVNLRSNDTAGAFASAAEYLHFALSIAPGASVRTINSLSRFHEEFTQELGLLANHADIQLLSLPEATLSIWDTVGLIKSLPLLSDLRSGIPTLGIFPQGVTNDELPEYVRSTYAPMGKRFRCWNISYV
ncbi:hypothetical protein GGF44_003185, partial [Coemansia sp. RSA 1694]